MKKYLLITLLLIFSSSTFSQTTWGIGLTAGTKSGFEKSSHSLLLTTTVGLNARGILEISDKFAFQFGASVFLPTKINSVSVYQGVINADLNYNFVEEMNLKAYMLGGLHLTSWTADVGHVEGTSYGFGTHLGVGLRVNRILVEFKYEFEKKIKDDYMDITHDGQIVGSICYLIH